jgi:DNA-directed RNA polymerase subunit E'/Rpb7
MDAYSPSYMQDENNREDSMVGGGKDMKTDQPKIYGVYIKSILTQKVSLHIREAGRSTKQNLEKKLVALNEGRCIPEGFIRPKSINILQYSSGLVNGENIEYQALFECMICYPAIGMIMECVVKTITKAGIHAEVITDNNVVPVTVFISREHHSSPEYFASIKENSTIQVRVLGNRFELNDPYICVIAELVKPQSENKMQMARKKGGLSRLTIH